MTIQREELMELVDQTWQVLFGEALEPSEAPLSGCEGVRAIVAIRGEWNGQVVVEFEHATAENVACRLLEAKPGELEDAEILDAAGEIANILAGNLKSMVPQPSSLGIPQVVAIDLDGSPDAGGNDALLVVWRWVDTQFSVNILVPGCDEE